MNRGTQGLPVHHKLPESTKTHVHRVGDTIQPSHPLSSPSPPALKLSQNQGLFQWVSSSHQAAKVLEFQLQYQSFQWTPRTDLLLDGLLDLLAVQGTLKSLLQHHSSKASILWCWLSFLYSPSLTSIHDHWTDLFDKVMSLLFNMLSRFLPRSKDLFISWLQSPSAVILEPPKNKVSHCFHCFSICLPWSGETGCHDLSFLNV